MFKHFTWTDRLKIEKMLKDGEPIKQIAKRLHFSLSAVYKEIQRGRYTHLNSDYTTEERYSPDISEQKYREHLSAKGADLKIGNDHKLANFIEDMSCANRETFEAELRGLEEICFQTTGVQISPFYRPPEGKYSIENLKWAQEMGYRTIFWSFAYADWDNHDQPKPERALKNLLSHVHNGEILLLHPTSETNAEILDSFLSELEAQGYRFGSLQELGQKTKADKRIPAQTTETGC